MGIEAAIVTAVAKAAASFSLSKFLIGTAVSLALNAASSALFGKKKPNSSGNTGVARPRKELIRASAEARRVVYGRARVSGVLAYAASRGNDNRKLDMVVMIAGHQCEALEVAYFNDVELPSVSDPVPSGKYKNYAGIVFYDGDSDQLADSYLVDNYDEWTDDHRLRGISYARVSLTHNTDVYPTGIPTPTFLVKGKKVLDPRTDLTEWSENPALIVLDYLLSSDGVGVSLDEIDIGSFIASANICDENVQLAGGETQKRYTLNGVVYQDQNPLDVIEDMLTTMAGSLVYTQGQYKLFAGAYREPSIEITQDDIIEGPVVTPRVPRQELFNRIRGTFIDPENYWQETDFPAIENITYEEQDNEQITREIELPFTIDTVMAQRLGKIHLEKSRQAIQVELTVNYKGLQIGVMETVLLTLPQLGWDQKPFVPLSWSFDSAQGIRLTLQEESSTVYDWDYGSAVFYDPAPNTSLPDPFTVLAPLSLTISTVSVGTSGGDDTYKMILEWAPATDQFVYNGGQYEIQVKESSEELYRPSFYVDGALSRADIHQVSFGESYDVRIRAINSLPKKSSWSALSNIIVGSGTGGISETEDWGSFDTVEDPVTETEDWGEYSDSVTETENYGEFV